MADPLLFLRARAALIGRRIGRWRDTLAARRAAWGARPRALRAWPEPFSPGDPERAALLAAGDLTVAGCRMRLGGLSPFAVPAPSQAALTALHGFGWLDDAQAAGKADRAVLRAWAFDWLRRFGGGSGPGWRADLAGRRLAHLVSAAPMLLAGADASDRARVLRALDAHLRFLDFRARAADPRALIDAATGLALGGVALEGAAAQARRGAFLLGAAASALIDAEGGLPTRNPQALGEAFAALAWTAEALGEGRVALNPRHVAALGRAGPALRALRLGDGGLARFHGGGAGVDGLLDSAFARAGAVAAAAAGAPEGEARRGRQRAPLLFAAMGFARLAVGRAVVILDAAAPPGGGQGCASALALEMSVGRQRLFGGIGPGAGFGPEWAVAARATAASAAIEIAGASAARLAPDGVAARVFGRGFAHGPLWVRVERAADVEGDWILAEHDGYAERFGLIVARRLRLAPDGRDLRAEDTVSAQTAEARARYDRAARDGALGFCVRFHLAPGVDVESAAAPPDPSGSHLSGAAAILRLPDGARWTLRAAGGALSVTDSVRLDAEGATVAPARQLVIAGLAKAYWGRVTWALTETSPPPARAGRAPRQI